MIEERVIVFIAFLIASRIGPAPIADDELEPEYEKTARELGLTALEFALAAPAAIAAINAILGKVELSLERLQAIRNEAFLAIDPPTSAVN